MVAASPTTSSARVSQPAGPRARRRGRAARGVRRARTRRRPGRDREDRGLRGGVAARPPGAGGERADQHRVDRHAGDHVDARVGQVERLGGPEDGGRQHGRRRQDPQGSRRRGPPGATPHGRRQREGRQHAEPERLRRRRLVAVVAGPRPPAVDDDGHAPVREPALDVRVLAHGRRRLGAHPVRPVVVEQHRVAAGELAPGRSPWGRRRRSRRPAAAPRSDPPPESVGSPTRRRRRCAGTARRRSRARSPRARRCASRARRSSPPTTLRVHALGLAGHARAVVDGRRRAAVRGRGRRQRQQRPSAASEREAPHRATGTVAFTVSASNVPRRTVSAACQAPGCGKVIVPVQWPAVEQLQAAPPGPVIPADRQRHRQPRVPHVERGLADGVRDDDVHLVGRARAGRGDART